MCRFGRIVSLKGHNQMRKYIQRWASLVDRSKLHSESGVEIARLRNQLCNLKATLHDLTNQDEAAASLAAERALNRFVAVPITVFLCICSHLRWKWCHSGSCLQ